MEQNLAELLFLERRRNGWSQRELSEKAEVGLGTIYAAENGANISLQTLIKLLSAYRLQLVVRSKDIPVDPNTELVVR